MALPVSTSKYYQKTMRITDIKIVYRDEFRLKAYASITLDDELVIRHLKVIQGESGLFVSMPSKRMGKNRFVDIAHPINTEFRKYLEDEILKRYLLHK